MNQGKLKVVRQEMARVNVDILGISELKWTGMGEFNSGDHYIYSCRQESLRRNGVTSQSTKESEMQSVGAISKMTECSLFISKANQVYAPTTNAKEAEIEQFYDELQDLP